VISLPELTLLFIIGLLVLGPERLPRVASQIGRWVGRARRTANQLRYQLEREIALADLEKSSTDRNKSKPDAPKPQAADSASTSDSDESDEAGTAEPAESAQATTSPDDDVKQG
jgi:sec-independent protein translocase protein TatB